MTTEPTSKSRVVLGPIAADMMRQRAGDEEPHRDHLEEAIQDLVRDRNALARTVDDYEALTSEGTSDTAAGQYGKLINQIAKLVLEGHLQLLELRKLCSAGFMQVSDHPEEALLEMERDMTRHQRQSLERIGVDLKEFDDENRFHDRELQQQIVQLKEKELRAEEKER